VEAVGDDLQRGFGLDDGELRDRLVAEQRQRRRAVLELAVR
jgi:hypothetical protein